MLITNVEQSKDTKRLASVAEALNTFVTKCNYEVPQHLRGIKGGVYGEAVFCYIIAGQMRWTLQKNPDDWLTTLPEKYVSRKVEYGHLSDFSNFEEPFFIKPIYEKLFKAKAYNNSAELMACDDWGTVEVLKSDVMNFTSKYRCVVKDKQVITACCYYLKDTKSSDPEIDMKKNYLHNNDAVIDFVNNMLNDKNVECVNSTVIDVGRFKKDTYAVIKSKPVYVSKLYGCEPVAVLDAIKSACNMEKV